MIYRMFRDAVTLVVVFVIAYGIVWFVGEALGTH